MKPIIIEKIHSHTTHEETIKCAASFGRCWYKKSNKPNNKPNGTSARDGFYGKS